MSKYNRTVSQIEILAEQRSKEVGENGWFKQSEVHEIDAWGNKLQIKYRRFGGYEKMSVYSNGLDGLPLTKDDIMSHSYICDNVVVLAEIARLKREDRQDAVEGYGYRSTKGLTKGFKESLFSPKK